MIIWISGVGAVGKSTTTNLLKEKLHKHYSEVYEGDDHRYTSKNGYKIPFSTYGKVMVLGRTDKNVLYGTDGVMIGLSKVQDFLHNEYFKWKSIFTPHIIIEGHKYISKSEMHDFLIKEKMKYKMYYLHAPRNVLTKRSKKRANGWDKKTRTESLIDKQIQEYEKVIKKYKDNIVIRESTSVQKCQEISNEIFKELNLT